jgi:hypothetical protein
MTFDANEPRLLLWCRGPDYDFPEPSFHAQCFGGFELWPVRTHAELRDETMNMRHCVAAAASHVAGGHLYAISVRQGGGRVATALVALTADGYCNIGNRLLSVRGYKDTLVPDIEDIVREWLAA